MNLAPDLHSVFFFFIVQYFLWRFPDDVDTVVVKAESKDTKLCAILSIQGTQVLFTNYACNKNHAS